MEDENIEVPQVLQDVKNMLSDRATNYIVVVEIDGNLWTKYSSPCSAFGMSAMAADEIRTAWNMQHKANFRASDADDVEEI